jgi:hypothetical protein
MASNSFKVKNSLVLTPKDLSTLVSPEAGDLACDINDSNKIKRYDATAAAWVEVGSGGSGVGGVDILFVQDFESAGLSSFTQTGLSLSQTDPLKGKVSALLTHQAAVNQSFKQVISVDRKFRGQAMTLGLDCKSSASQGNVVVNIYDETNAANIVASSQLQLANDVNGAKTSVAFVIPETCASLSYTITALPQAGSPTTRIDDIICQLAQSQVIQSGLVATGDSYLTAAGNAGQAITADVTNIPFTTISTVGTDIVSNGSQITVATSGLYSFSGSVFFTTSTSRAIQLYVNDTLFRTISDFVLSFAQLKFDAPSVYLNAGDVVSFRSNVNGGTLSNSTTSHWLTVTREGSLKQVSVNSNQKITIPTHELRITGSSSRGTGDGGTRVKFDTLQSLRGDAFTITNDATGTSVIMKKAGRLSANFSLVSSATFAQLYVAGLPVAIDATGTTGGGAAWTGDVKIGDTVYVIAGAAPTSNVANGLFLSFQEQDIQVSVSNTLPQFSESDLVVRAGGNSGQAITAAVTNIPFTTIYDSTGGQWNGSQFTVAEDGTYSITAMAIFTTTAARSLAIFVDGAEYKRIAQTSTSDSYTQGSSTLYLTRGQVVSIRAIGNGGTLNSSLGSPYHYIDITKVGKPNVTGVNVTPFVNVPQPDSQNMEILASGTYAAATIAAALTRSSGSTSLISYNSSTGIYTTLKSINLSASFSLSASAAASVTPVIVVNGVDVAVDVSPAVANNWGSAAYVGTISAGSTFSFRNASNTGNALKILVLATALSDQILTATETFSTDTASLTYAGSGTYTLSTLANAPVGTYITFTYAANTNTRTQTTTRPTQTDADMNANGMLLYTRAYNAASTAAQPAAIAIQIGKGMKGKSLDLYKSAGKVTSGELDWSRYTTDTVEEGCRYKDYNESTGVLLIDAGVRGSSVTSASFSFNDITAQTSGYLVINASKNPALAGIGLNRVAARVVQSSGQSIPNGVDTAVVFDSTKVFDTHGAFNTSTGVFTAPEAGYYSIGSGLMSASVAWTAGALFQVFYKKNGVGSTYNRFVIQASVTQFIQATGSDLVYLAKGDTIQFFVYQTRGSATSLHTDPTFNYAFVSKVSV